MIDLTPIANAIISLAALLITTFLIPWIKTKVSTEKLAEIQKWTTIAVEAAEMIYRESGMGEAKKKYVDNYLKSKTLAAESMSAKVNMTRFRRKTKPHSDDRIQVISMWF